MLNAGSMNNREEEVRPMLKQTFVVTLEIPSPFDRYFPTVEAGRVANIIRDGIEAKSVSFIGPAEFTIRWGRVGR
jgi:hypothetical protein